MPDLKDYYWDKIEKSKGNHHWDGSVNNIGYPKMKVDGKMRLASHVALEMDGRKVPKDSVVMHRDNNPKNLHPDNLSIGTQKENLKKMRDQGRDRPRGVDQEPDVKQAASLAGPERRMADMAQSAFKKTTAKTVKMAAFLDELEKISNNIG
jgi:hypothetical protein